MSGISQGWAIQNHEDLLASLQNFNKAVGEINEIVQGVVRDTDGISNVGNNLSAVIDTLGKLKVDADKVAELVEGGLLKKTETRVAQEMELQNSNAEI